jgi:hypothetical protein
MLFPIPNGFSLTIAGFYTLAFLMVSSATGRVGAATLTGLFILLFRYLAWFVTPWATKVYSASIGLSVRDDPSQFPPLTEDIPLYAFAVGLLLDGLLLLCKRQNFSVRLSVIFAGAITALLFVLPVQFIWGSWDGLAMTTPFVALLVGALLGFTGWKLGAVLRDEILDCILDCFVHTSLCTKRKSTRASSYRNCSSWFLHYESRL